MTEVTYTTEAEAHEQRRHFIDTLNASVTLIAFDPARNVYAFDVATAPSKYDEVYPTPVHTLTAEQIRTELTQLEGIGGDLLDPLAPIRYAFLLRELTNREAEAAELAALATMTAAEQRAEERNADGLEEYFGCY